MPAVSEKLQGGLVSRPRPLRILWLNWRDIRNPDAGGAELFTHEVAKRLVQRGWGVTLFSAMFPNAQKEEEVDGVQVVRHGGKLGVYGKAKEYYRSHQSGFDLVIDEINTRPFMTPRFVRNKPIVALIHQLAREYWFEETPWPISWLGYHVLEDSWLKNYRRVKTITVSRSTKLDLEQLGFEDVVIVPEGISVPVLDDVPQKEETPTLLFVGRLKRSKKPDHAVKAHRLVRQRFPNARLWIVGDGYMRKQLERSASAGVEVKGRVDENTKIELMTRAHVLLFPALREGWGLSINEANARGTPAIAYDVPGVRDAIRASETGILVRRNDWHSLAVNAIEILENQLLFQRMATSALDFARRLTWENSASQFEETILHSCRGQ